MHVRTPKARPLVHAQNRPGLVFASIFTVPSLTFFTDLYFVVEDVHTPYQVWSFCPRFPFVSGSLAVTVGRP